MSPYDELFKFVWYIDKIDGKNYVSRGYIAIEVRIEGFFGERFFMCWIKYSETSIFKMFEQKTNNSLTTFK
jgi:hypothetical protein